MRNINEQYNKQDVCWLVANEELIFERDTNVPTTDICYTRSRTSWYVPTFHIT